MAVNGFDKRPNDINRKGAPKKEWTWAGLIRKMVDELDLKDNKVLKEKMVKSIINKAIAGDVSAFKELSNRTDGLPQAKLDITSKNKEILTNEQINEILNRRTGENMSSREI